MRCGGVVDGLALISSLKIRLSGFEGCWGLSYYVKIFLGGRLTGVLFQSQMIAREVWWRVSLEDSAARVANLIMKQLRNGYLM